MNNKRQRSSNLTDHDIERILGVLDGWSGKLTWTLLTDEIENRLKEHYTRQTLASYNRIQSTYTLVKERLKDEIAEELNTTPESMAVLIQQNKRLEAEVDRLHRENNELLAQFITWSRNAYMRGLTIDDLNKPLPLPPRNSDE